MHNVKFWHFRANGVKCENKNAKLGVKCETEKCKMNAGFFLLQVISDASH